ncbi:MAG: GMC family oxidoreductase [Pseudomonadota bacterium]
MLLDARDFESGTTLDADICVLGAGAAGVTLARELVQGGFQVCVLESGGLEYDDAAQDLYRAEASPEFFPDPQWSRLRYLGGATNHWEGNCSPLSEEDFKVRSWVPNSGWPFERAALDDAYVRANVYCEIDAESILTIYNAPVTPPPPELSFKLGLAKTEITKASPPTRFAERWAPDLASAKNADLVLNATAHSVALDAGQTRIETVRAQVIGGGAFDVKAKYVCLCLGGIENARMLKIWNAEHGNKLGDQFDAVGRYFMEHPLGEFAFILPSAERAKYNLYAPGRSYNPNNGIGYMALTEKAQEENAAPGLRVPLMPVDKYYASDGISSYHLMTDSLSNGAAPDYMLRHVKNMVLDFDMVLEAVSRQVFRRKLFKEADDFTGFGSSMMIEQYPDRQNRITLGEERDALGLRRSVVEWRVPESEKEGVWRAVEAVGRDFAASRHGRFRLLKERDTRIWGSQLSYGHHHMGTTRMAKSPETGVVDANAKVFGMENFYVGGSSVFPTGGHVPPTLTLVALAVRLADHLKQKMGAPA